VDDFSSKLDLPRELETVESIDANHMQMARYCNKDEHGYRAISGVLKSFVRQELDGKGTSPARPADVSCTYSRLSSTWYRTLMNLLLLAPDVLFMVPFSRDDLFVGREDIIAKISEKRNKQAASRNHTRIALVGLGGIGYRPRHPFRWRSDPSLGSRRSQSSMRIEFNRWSRRL